jgi:endonuclease/exonuclease/phosphatase family metal-dependent hydrolase
VTSRHISDIRDSSDISNSGDQGGAVRTHARLETRRDPQPGTRKALAALAAVLVTTLAVSLVAVAGPGATARATKKVTNPTSFRVTSFNILGSSHTAAGGSKSRMASGKVRAGYTVRLLDNQTIDVAGLQEVQVSQFEEIKRLRGSTWDAHPGRALTNWDTHNSLLWRTSVWERVEARTVAIPYFRGKKLQMPYVLLRHRTTGQQVWFANFHNPASSKKKKRGDQSHWRAVATSIQKALALQLRATGHPVVFTGDMNEKKVYFCRFTKGTAMKAANGGSNGSAGCRPPTRMRIDWIFGSKELRFSGYKDLRTPLVRKTSDHAMIVSQVTVPAG